ncbi:MAG: diguanylate cyclase [Faecalicatena sp.]|nr:EAL domain-containing protein [Faecalicatena sp.]MCI6466530.1 diguanylate cyclase [Faecalicatena sp.]
MLDMRESEEYKLLLERANYDDLTKVLNRRAGKEYLEGLLDKAKCERKVLSVALCDINDLKYVNDKFGHREGDHMLRYVASLMTRQLRAYDLVFRLSGDEFVMAYYDEDQRNAERRMADILDNLEAKRKENGIFYDVSFSYGFVEIYPEEHYTVSDIIAKADAKMYIQKRSYHIKRAKQKLKQHQDGINGIQQFEYDKEHLFDALLYSTDDYIFVGNMKTGTFRYPPAMVEEFGLPGQIVENAAAFWGEIIHPHDEEGFLESNQDIADGRTEYHDIEYRARNVRGEWIWLRCRGKMIRDEQGVPNMFAGMITNLGRKDQIDHMTGLYNRFEFEGDAKKYLVDQEGTKELGIMILDMDSFRNINDLYNRSFGDEILRVTAQKIAELLPYNARVYRLDGDEFGVLILNGNEDEALEIFNRIQQKFQKQQDYNGRKYYCTISGGYVSYPNDSDNYQELLKYANYSLEYSKAMGKNKITVFSLEILQRKEKKLNLTELLRESIEREYAGFSVSYQPQVDSVTKELYGAEALARWNCSVYGRVSPLEFIPILEQSGMIIQVGKWIFEKAVRQCREWRRLKPDFNMSINLSYLQLLEEDFVSFVDETMESLGVPYENITLELTESYLIEQDGMVHDMMECLQKKGIKVAMDDFGVGYSSLFELKNTPADIIKIDRAFVKGLTSDIFTGTFIRSITELCHNVGKRVCMEGVETQEEYDIVKDIGLDLIQGFYFGEPIVPEMFEKRYF